MTDVDRLTTQTANTHTHTTHTHFQAKTNRKTQHMYTHIHTQIHTGRVYTHTHAEETLIDMHIDMLRSILKQINASTPALMAACQAGIEPHPSLTH